ncbi:hypothetical protein HUG10_04625 [Halorarum halophilum]|uniref:Uncharacterized protein n=1 Tax=Halorarum halophilum TaxID=2743090 RepID=A0A7D5GDS7_9EURY|nr:hypothetical protein [Halobaculum halophilum]QLG26868.1 hypothetical protein HUG10_04625 [Halobaculum halophilum]
MNEHNPPKIDENRLAELMQEYASASNREQEREIESEVLKETVWRVGKDGRLDGWATFSRDEWMWLTENVEAKNMEAEAKLRRPYLQVL